jgi:hypothetical protein
LRSTNTHVVKLFSIMPKIVFPKTQKINICNPGQMFEVSLERLSKPLDRWSNSTSSV